jgi:hypothetical protein
MLVDEDTFFGNSSLTNNSVAENGLWSTSNNKTEIFWSVAFEGDTTGDYYISALLVDYHQVQVLTKQFGFHQVL